MQYTVLLIGISMLVILTLFFFDGDYLMPSVVLNTSYILSLLVLLLSPLELSFHWNTVVTILVGLFSFQFAELVLFKRRKGLNCSRSYEKKCISYFTIVIVIFIQILTIVFYIQDIKRIGQSGLWESVKNMRRMNMYSASLGSSDYVRFYVSRLMKINFAAGYVNSFLFIRDITCKKRNRFTLFYLISVCFYLIQAILSGGRAQALRLFFAVFITVLLTYRMEYGWRSRLRFSTVIKVMVGIIVAGAAFYGSRVFFGRINQVNLSFASVLTSYYSGGIYLFNEYMQHPIRNTGSMVGAQTFKDFYNLLYKYGLRSYRIIPQLEFRNMGDTVNNTYTAFRYYYQDFGIKGVVVLQAVLSLIYNFIYSRVKHGGKEYAIVVYSFIFYALIMHCISDQFFSILSFGYVETIMWILIIWCFETSIAVRITPIPGDNEI